MNEPLLTVKDLSTFLDLHPATIYKMIKKGEIPFTKRKGLGIRFDQKKIETWIAEGSIKINPLLESISNVDIALENYDRMFLKRRTELKGQTRWNYGIGSVIRRKTKNKEDRFYIDFQIGKYRVREAVKGARTRAEAVKVLNSKAADTLRGKYNFKKENSDITFSEMSELYLEKYAKIKKKKSWKTSDWVYLHVLKPFFGSYKLSEIKPEIIEDYTKERLATGIKECSVNRELSCLRKIFNVAIDWDRAKDNPLRKVKFFSEKENLRERVLTDDEEKLLFEASSSHIRPILMVALYTGMRKGEIFRLRWKNVDLEKREIKSVESKSGRGRTLPINSTLFEVLSALKRQNGRTEFVFTNPETGKPYVDIKKAFKGAWRRAGIKDLRFHDLRHTFASRLVKKGVDLIIVKELMGHVSVITTQRYTHSQAKEKSQAVETLTRKPQYFDLECQKNVKSGIINSQGKVLNNVFSVN